MIDLNKIVNETLVNLEKEKFVEKAVQQRLEKTITDIVDDVFREWSDFGKNLKEYIEKNLNVDLNNLGIEGYNTLVLATIKEQLDKIITVQGLEKIKKTTEEILSNVKDEYTLSEIIEELKGEDYRDEWEYNDYDKIALIIEDSRNGYKHIYLGEEDENNKYCYDYQIHIDREGKPYNMKLKGDEINTNKILGGLYGLDKLLFKIYAHGSKIILDQGEDPENYNIYYKEED